MAPPPPAADDGDSRLDEPAPPEPTMEGATPGGTPAGARGERPTTAKEASDPARPAASASGGATAEEARRGQSPPHGRQPSHDVLRSLLGAWALAACSAEETAAVEAHLNDCVPCAEEALRLREAVALLRTEESLDLDPRLRSRVLEGCLVRRPPRVPVPEWATVFDTEAARLDALLRDFGPAEWRAEVRLRWFDGERTVARATTVAGVIAHLMAVDGILASALGMPDPLGPGAPDHPMERTAAIWQRDPPEPSGGRPRPTRARDGADRAGPYGGASAAPDAIRGPWRKQAHAMVRNVSLAGRGGTELSVPFGDVRLPMRDSFLDRALECWVHAGDIADAVSYPYEPPAADHLHEMIGFWVEKLPGALAERRRAGLAAPPRELVEAGRPGRALCLEVEGSGGGRWYIPLDSPAAVAGPERQVAHIAMDLDAFHQLMAGHVDPRDAAAGAAGDPEAVRDVLLTSAALSRM
ncbi:zf-HC2 domain-containing protein [Streptomyces sp. LX-29]|uniref:anti-sigma factor family protein n=1 Tax=Streptomyces sp. LX-29 TaxID=2900152 RepID=UPI00240DEE80|nr:zf-HC2 domain-containing protein [Streptomyces sp. LX-29]WFB11722.1 zf-HC2 domain-containing protein [Streptomyces sp. LX-29]